MSENTKIRIHYNFSGQVQGVGFRYTACHLADSLGLTGFVQNEYDGSVTMEVQGDEASIDELIARINDGRWIQIEDICKSRLEVDENERTFDIRG